MDKRLIADMQCPYCGGGFRIARESRSQGERLQYGLIECSCFRFPVVDGILLLSLAKGFGGAEEILQPYVPLQAAAVRNLEKDDVDGLLAWMRRHSPLAAELIEGTPTPYLPLATRLDLAVDREAQRFLDDYGRYEVVGTPRRRERWRKLFAGPPSKAVPASATEAQKADKLASYYVSRFFSPRVNALALQLGALPMDGRILSLCCGHGVFENLLAADGRARDVVCMDGQLINLLITRRYGCPNGTFICHDLQYPLPFADRTFQGVFSSTCLPEIPAQRTFAAEAIRVTALSGWTFFDSIWNTEMGVERIHRYRHYRFCQNFFASLDDYVPMFERCAGPEREVGIDIPGMPQRYRDGVAWAFGPERTSALAERTEPEISVLVRGRSQPFAATKPARAWMSPARLSVSPAYVIESGDKASVALRRRPQFKQLTPSFAPAVFGGYAESLKLPIQRAGDAAWLAEAFDQCHLALLPADFDQASRTLAALTGAGG